MRTDTHRPSAINPAEYEYVAPEHIKIEGFGDCAYVLEMRRRIKEHMARTGGTYAHVETTGNCQVCGSVNAIYTVLFYHRPSNSYIRTGQDCADKLDLGYNKNEINLFHTAIKQDSELRAGKRKALATLAEAGLGRVWDIVEQLKADRQAEQAQFDVTGKSTNWKPGYEEITMEDIVSKLVRYGSISDAQKGFLGKLLDRIDNRAAMAAQRKAEADAAGPAPTGRVRVKGTVLALKTVEYESRFYGDSGIRTKVLIKLENGSKVYGNRFANVEKGDTVEFTARFELGENPDPKFAFFSRPKIHADKNFQPVNGVITRIAQ